MDLPDQRLRERRIKEGKSECPLRVILSASGNISISLSVFEKGDAPIVIYSTERMAPAQRRLLSEHAAVHVSGSDGLDLFWLLWHLYEHYLGRSLVCEGGPTLVKALPQSACIAEINLTNAAKIFAAFSSPPFNALPAAISPPHRHF